MGCRSAHIRRHTHIRTGANRIYSKQPFRYVCVRALDLCRYQLLLFLLDQRMRINLHLEFECVLKTPKSMLNNTASSSSSGGVIMMKYQRWFGFFSSFYAFFFFQVLKLPSEKNMCIFRLTINVSLSLSLSLD